MIHFIGKQQNLFEITPHIQSTTFVECLNYFKDHLEIQVDTETTGFNCHTDNLICIQLGDFENQFVIELEAINFEYLKAFMESDKRTFVAHNAKFDLGFLYSKNIFPKKIWDTFLAECILTTGMDLENGERGLDRLALKYTEVHLDKSIRNNIAKEGLTTRVIQYSADDVKYLSKIKEDQIKKLEVLDLMNVVALENEFVKCLAYSEWCGFKLDSEKWLKVDLENRKKLRSQERLLSRWVVENNVKKVSKQYDMFEECPTANINWSSSKQVIRLFEEVGVNCDVIEKGVKKKSVIAKHIERQKDKCSLIPLYLEYKEIEKQISTYGKSFLENVNSKTSRIHTNYFQIINTGRLSSSNPNLQNIPSTPEVRACFIAEKGNLLTVNDYSSQEPRCLAGLSNDSKLIDFFYNGDGDIHSFVASKLFSVINGKETIITKKNNDERQVGKIFNLKLNYGGTAYTVKDDIGKSEAEAQELIIALEKAFPEKENYFKCKIKETFSKGFITTNTVTRRKIFIPEITDFKILESRRKDFDKAGERPPKDFWKRYMTTKGNLERCSKNYPIQSTAADQAKLAGIRFFNYVVDNNLLGIVKVCCFVHDEIVVEAPENIINKVGNILQECMENSAKKLVANMDFPALPEITPYWKKG